MEKRRPTLELLAPHRHGTEKSLRTLGLQRLRNITAGGAPHLIYVGESIH
jgi:hypothetical protein